MNLLLGDIHGQFLKTCYNINNYSRSITDSTIYQVGDFGIFDYGGQITKITELDVCLGSTGNKMRVIRGNHDNPKYWNCEDTRSKFNKTHPNIELLPDYHNEVIDGKKVLFIGGGVSIDRFYRNSSSWWVDEIVVPPKDGISSLEEFDVIVAHSTPSCFNMPAISPTTKSLAINDDTLLKDLVDERELLDKIFEQAKPKRFYSGHFHNNDHSFFKDCEYRCLDIDEFREFVL